MEKERKRRETERLEAKKGSEKQRSIHNTSKDEEWY